MSEEPVSEPQSGSGTETQAQSGTPAGQSGSSAGGEGRTIDNVYGELSRKNKKIEDAITKLEKTISTLADRLTPQQPARQPGYGGNYTPAPPAPQTAPSPYGAPRPLAIYTDEQLHAGLQSGTLNPSDQEKVRQELSTRHSERIVHETIDARERTQRVNDLKKKSEKAALDAFPALRDSDSEFSRRVEAELQERRKLVGEAPTDKWDVANSISRQMNVEVSRAFVPGYIAPAGEAPFRQTEAQRETKQLLPDAEIERLARKFEQMGTMPVDFDKDGKQVRRKFNIDRLKKSSRDYAEASDVMRGPGVRYEK